MEWETLTLSSSRKEITCPSRRLRQIIDWRDTDKSRYFATPEFNNHSFDQLNMSNHSLPVRVTDPPFSHKSVVAITHERNIIWSKTHICRQLFASHVVSSRPMKRKEILCQRIIQFVCRKYRHKLMYELWTSMYSTCNFNKPMQLYQIINDSWIKDEKNVIDEWLYIWLTQVASILYWYRFRCQTLR